jgi:hypothetical protein
MGWTPPPVTASNVPKWAFCKLDVEAAHRAYFVHAWSDPEDDTQLCLHAFFDVPQLGIGRNTLNACNEFFSSSLVNLSMRVSPPGS